MGNPHAQSVTRLRSALLANISTDDFSAVIAKLNAIKRFSFSDREQSRKGLECAAIPTPSRPLQQTSYAFQLLRTNGRSIPWHRERQQSLRGSWA